MNVTWVYVGDLDVAVEGRMPLLHIPKDPGLYRLISEGHCYVGQAQNVRDRVYEYCRPTQHLEHEHRLHWLLRGKQCRVEVVVTPEMKSLTYRRSQEKVAFEQSREEGFVLWNLSQHPKTIQYQMLIEYHEVMIRKYAALITTSNKAPLTANRFEGKR